MTTVDIHQITADARKIQPAQVVAAVLRFVLVAIGRTLWGIGWTVRKTFAVLWLAGTWSWTAARLGWQDAAPKPRT